MSPVSRARADAKTQLMLDTLARDIESHPEKLRTVDEQLVDRMVAVSGFVIIRVALSRKLLAVKPDRAAASPRGKRRSRSARRIGPEN